MTHSSQFHEPHVILVNVMAKAAGNAVLFLVRPWLSLFVVARNNQLVRVTGEPRNTTEDI